MRPDRLGVRGKLNMLLALPLAAVMLVAVPLVVDSVGTAQSASTTATAANNARLLGTLVWQLQRERLITAGYLASADADPVELLTQQQTVGDLAATIHATLGSDASDEIDEALVRVGSLTDLRQNALRRSATVDSIVRTYHAVIESVINALRLTAQRGTDADGARQLAALDALLRASEQSTLRALAIAVAATAPQTGLSLLASASDQFDVFTERFVEQASENQSALVVLVDEGETARQLNDLAKRLGQLPTGAGRDAFVAETLTVADAQAGLRRMVLDQVTTEIANDAADRAVGARRNALALGFGTVTLFAVVILLALTVSRSISDPLRQLTEAASTTADLANAELTRVADVEDPDEQPPRLTTIDIAAGHEVGALAAAFNRVQATAALLLERQVVSRRNVSLMFANVAKRTQNLVTRQLALVDELERNEQNPKVLAGLYQIDHVSTRLRRTSENLLVIAGTRDGAKIARPAPLADVLRSAVAEIADFVRVRFEHVTEAVVAAPLVSDLVLVLAEIMENATAFSPPETSVTVTAIQQPDRSCLIRVTDRGIGMASDRLYEVNRRLVESERLDVTPTSVLGLFVVGRIARRHGLGVELSSPGQGGIIATVVVPPNLIVAVTVPPFGSWVSAPVPARHSSAPGLALPPPVPTVPVTHTDDFSWFADELRLGGRVGGGTAPALAGASMAVSEVAPAPEPGPESRHGLNRRVPGMHHLANPQPQSDRVPARDAAVVRTMMDDYQAAVGRASMPGPRAPVDDQISRQSVPPVHGGLERRVPGMHLAPGLRDRPAAVPSRSDHRPPNRDAVASRAAFDGYADGLLRAAAHHPDIDRESATNPFDEGEPT